MKPFGQTLKEAREAKGLSTSALARETHLLVQIVEGLENENFKRIPAPVYGRGFVKLYCETVGLDPKPMIDAFLDLYEGRTPSAPAPFPPEAPVEPTAAAEPAVPPAAVQPQPAPEAPAEPTADLPPVVRGLALFDHAAEPETAETSASPFAAVYAHDEPKDETAMERFRKGLSSVSHGVIGTSQRIPRHVWRIAALGTGAAGIVIGIVWCCCALYRATDGSSAPTEKPAEVAADTPSRPAPVPAPVPAAGKLRVSGIPVPSAYVD